MGKTSQAWSASPRPAFQQLGLSGWCMGERWCAAPRGPGLSANWDSEPQQTCAAPSATLPPWCSAPEYITHTESLSAQDSPFWGKYTTHIKTCWLQLGRNWPQVHNGFFCFFFLILSGVCVQFVGKHDIYQLWTSVCCIQDLRMNIIFSIPDNLPSCCFSRHISISSQRFLHCFWKVFPVRHILALPQTGAAPRWCIQRRPLISRVPHSSCSVTKEQPPCLLALCPY